MRRGNEQEMARLSIGWKKNGGDGTGVRALRERERNRLNRLTDRDDDEKVYMAQWTSNSNSK